MNTSLTHQDRNTVSNVAVNVQKIARDCQDDNKCVHCRQCHWGSLENTESGMTSEKVISGYQLEVSDIYC